MPDGSATVRPLLKESPEDLIGQKFDLPGNYLSWEVFALAYGPEHHKEAMEAHRAFVEGGAIPDTVVDFCPKLPK